MSALPSMQSVKCEVPSAKCPDLKRLDPKSKLSMDLTAAYLATRKFTRMAVDGLKKRNRDWAKRELAKALVKYDALKKQAEREGFTV